MGWDTGIDNCVADTGQYGGDVCDPGFRAPVSLNGEKGGVGAKGAANTGVYQKNGAFILFTIPMMT